MRRLAGIAAGVVCGSAFVLTGCSSGNGSSSPQATSPQAPGTGAAGAPPGAQVLGTVDVGQPFTITFPSSNTAQPSKLKLTVKSVVCGKGLDPAVIAYAEQGGTSSAPPTPAGGSQFCVVSMTAQNVGDASATWSANYGVGLNVGAVQYVETSNDQDLELDYAQVWFQRGQPSPTFGINPGAAGPVNGVFEIPVGAKPTSAWVSGGSITALNGPAPGYLVRL
ncbi:hypothetical protein ActroDRAFT_0197 [Actinospica robiniae DSM 44927]|uniref:DUF4352 domain-containing protein n=1 Tax=Actinospica robiniae DSM 44927 TaxID=479430 RepID=W9E4L8_9ACTN|nr:hypothetical protein ActroDRAFT_0197 [Actinospica robiniae DSM 44927]